MDASTQDEAVSTSLVIINGFLVFFMQVGFLAVETGSGRAKNVRNILLKNLLDVMLAALVWWAVGFAFAYGKSAAGVIGTSQFFYEGESLVDKAVRPWFFSWTFCIAACTIISGCLAERTALVAYPVATVLIAAVVHPLLVHWLWNPQGWLNKVHECGVLDFAGGMVVHMLGGLFGLVGAYVCGPRLGRFELLNQDDDDSDEQQQGQAWQDYEQQGQEGSSDQAAAAYQAAATAGASGHAASRRTNGQAGLVDSAFELDGSSSPPNAATAAAAAAEAEATGQPVHHQQQQQLVEMGQVKHQQQQQQQPGSACPPLAGCSQSSMAGTAAGSSSLQPPPPLQQQQQEAAAAAAVGQADGGNGGAAAAAASSNSNSSGSRGWFSWLRLRQQRQQQQRRRQQRQRQRRRRVVMAAHADEHSTSAATCGAGICKFVPKAMPGHDMAFVTLGTFMLWFGWFGFNNGSVYMYINGNPVPEPGALAGAVSAEVVQRTSMNTALGGAAAGLTSLLCAAVFWGTYDLRICCNGVLSGLVIVTCMCGYVDPWAAVVCSAIAGAMYAGASWALLRIGIDDPLDSSAVHFGSGVLGSIMVAFVANPKHVYALTGTPCGGIFYGSSGWVQLGMQLLGIVVVITFAGSAAWVMFWLLNRKGLLRVDQMTELAGIDNMEHGGPAYPEFTASWRGSNSLTEQGAVAGGRRLMS